MPNAEIIAIGTELLLGQTLDTNTQFLAIQLRTVGIDLFRTTIVGDNVDRIAEAIRESLRRADIVITSGGLGPTVDDPTRLAVAHAVDSDLEFRADLWTEIQARFNKMNRVPSQNNRRQAYIPAGASSISNPLGTAPAFVTAFDNKLIISLPGVPRELEYLMEHSVLPLLKSKFDLDSFIKYFLIHTSGIGESQVDELIGDLEKLTNPSIGLTASQGQVDIRITIKAKDEKKALFLQNKFVRILEEKLGENIFGYEHDTLASVVINKLNSSGLRLSLIECGLRGKLIQALNQSSIPLENLTTFNTAFQKEKLESLVLQCQFPQKKSCLLGVSMINHKNTHSLHLILKVGRKIQRMDRTLLDFSGNSMSGLMNIILDFIRRII